MMKVPNSPIERLARAIELALRPDQKVNVDEWAEANRVLPDDAPEPGPYRIDRTPYSIDVQRAISPGSNIKEAWLMGAHQLGKSAAGENAIGTWICAAAGSIIVSFPIKEDAAMWEETRFEPMRQGTRELSKRIRPAFEKGSRNTKFRKRYPGGSIRLVTANRPPKSSTIRYAKVEEPDEYPLAVNGQGDYIGLLRLRLSNYGVRGKLFGDGTPTIKGASVIHREFLRGDQRRWHLFCPECKHPQPLEMAQLKWTDGDPETTKYACIDCGVLNDEVAWKLPNYRPRPGNKTEEEAKAAGLAHYVATAKGEPHFASWHWTGLMAPLGWRPWTELARDWLLAQSDVEQLKIFVNTELGEPYEEKAAAMVAADVLRKRCEVYDKWTAPPAALLAVAGVDVQDNRLAVEIRAYGRGEENWGIWADEIYGDPSTSELWAKLADVLNTNIKHANGQMMPISVACIDAGGHHQEDVYAFCQSWGERGKKWFAIRGASQFDAMPLGRPKKLSFNYKGVEIPGGASLRFLGTQAIKTKIDARFKAAVGPGAYHWPMDYPTDYFEQIRSEKRVWHRDSKGHKALVWKRGSERNEYWDCLVYNYAAFLIATQGSNLEKIWNDCETIYGLKAQGDLLDSAVVVPPPIDPIAAIRIQKAMEGFQRQRKKTGFATTW
jgi:phage terminase large subunit GpA-like protein